MGGPRGYDGAKKIKGRKRHLLVDTQGNLLKNSVHPADIHDRAGAEILLSDLQHLFPAIKLVWADTAYRGLQDWLQKALDARRSEALARGTIKSELAANTAYMHECRTEIS